MTMHLWKKFVMLCAWITTTTAIEAATYYVSTESWAQNSPASTGF